MAPVRALAIAGAATLATSLLAPTLRAQSAQRVSIQTSALFVGTSGSAYQGINAGPGLEMQLRYTPSLWSFGVGAQVSRHGLSEPGFGGERVMLAGAFFEPRRVFEVSSPSFAPYASGRLAFLRQSIDLTVEGTRASASASGAQVNVGGGVLMRLTPRVNLDLGATMGLIRFGKVQVNVPGYGTATVDGTSGTGRNLVARVGVAVGLGR